MAIKQRKKKQTRSATYVTDQKAVVLARGKLIVISFVLIALLWGIHWGWSVVTASDFLPIQQVTISDQTAHVDPTILINTLKPLTSTGFFSVDIQAITQTVAHLPWVENVRVSRIWPSTLLIDIVEREPVARWGDSQLLDRHGIIFTPEKIDGFDALPQFIGPEHLALFMWQTYQTMQTLLNSQALQIKQVTVTNRRSWQITLTNGLNVVLGNRNMVLRLGRFITVYPTVFADKKTQATEVDLRYTNGFAIK